MLLLGVDFVLAFTSLPHVFIPSVLKFFRLPSNYIRLVMIVMKAPHNFMVGVRPVRTVMCLPKCGIRQGGCLSPAIFSVCASIFLWQLSGKRLLDYVYVFMYVDDLMLVFPIERNFDLVQRVMDCVELLGLVSGLRMNPDKTQWMCKGAPQAECARSATIWASGRTRDPYFEILRAPRGITVTRSGGFEF